MRKRITSALLTLVMLLSLIPAMGTTAAAADTETYPEMVNFLSNSEYRLCYYTDKWDDYNSREYKKVSINDITGSTPDEIWQNFTTKYAQKGVVGWIYYIQETGTLYIKGTVPSIAFRSKADAENVLKVIVDGDTTIERAIYGYDGSSGSIAPGLKKMTIDFRNGSTLTLSKNTAKEKKAILDITETGGNAGISYGDLELTGDGTLKIAPPDHTPYVMFGIRANNISVLDNVSLDIKMGSRYQLMNPVSAAAITCEGKLNINTTGTVKIDVSEKIDPSAKDDRGYFKVFSAITNTDFNLTHAKSVTLKAREKKDTFVAYYDYVTGGENWYSTIMTALRNNDWTVTETEDTAKPSYTVTMTPQAMSTAAQLTVGDNPSVKNIGSAIPSVTVNGGETVAVKASVKLPAWLSDMYTTGRVKLGDSRTMNIYKGNSLSSADLVTGSNMTGYAVITNATALPAISFETSNFKPVAGQTYTVYASFPIVTVNGGKQLGSASVLATIKAVEKPDEVISSVNLTGNALKEGDTAGPTLTKADSDTSYTVKPGAPWNITGSVVAGKEYYTYLYVKAADGYVFPTDWDQLRSIISVKLGNTPVRKLGISLTEDAKTLVLAVYAIADHVHSWSEWKHDEDCHYRECTICKAVSDKIPHSWSDWVNNDEDTQKRTCSDCGYSETRAKPERPISFLKINIIRPEAGATPSASDLTIRDAYKEQVGIVPNSVGWYDESGNPVTDAFEKGVTYTIKAQFKAKGERIFADTITTAGLFFTLDETKTLSTDKKTVDYSCTFTAYESVTVDTALPTLKVGEAMPLPTVADGREYNTVNVLYSAGADMGSLSYDGSKWQINGADATEEDLKVKADTVYVYSYTIKEGKNEKVTAILTATGNSITSDATGNWVTASYDTSSMNKIASVDLTVTAPEYGKAPATTAAGADDTKYTVGTPTWTDNDATFGAKAYTVTIPVTAETGYSFAAGCTYTVNGYTATYKDGKVSYTFPALTAPHSHNYGAWEKLDDSYHSRTCTAGDDIQVEAHTWGSWATVDGNTHKRTCNDCGAEQTADHNWVLDHVEDATFTAPGKTVYKCDDNCGVTNKEEPIAQLVEIDAANLTVAKPVKDVAAAEATTADTAYYVAATEWVAEDDTVLDIANGDKFQPGTVYTVKIYLEAADSNRFTKDTKFTINGQTAAVSPALNEGENTDSIVLTYTFDATEAGTVTPTGEYDFNVLNGKAYNNSTGVQIADNNIKPEEAVKVAAGTVVKVVADNMDSVGLYFDKWMVINGDIALADESSATTTFTMPEKAVKVLAVYERHVNSLSITDMTLKVGAEGTLTANVVPEVYKSEIEWSSSNEDIATVNGFGKVTAKAVGETTITATIYTKFTTDPPEYISATCTVTVEAADTPTNYTVTVQNDGNGTATATPAAAAAGTEVTLSATANTGYHFKEWQVLSGGVTVTDNKFTMPANDVTVKAIFGADAPITYTITFHANGGTASADSAQTGENGKLASLPTASRSGYTFDGWYTAETGGTKVTTDTVFDKDTTVYAHWTYKGSTSGDSSSGSATYTVTVLDSANGSVTADRKTAPAGAVVTLTVTADKGCALETLTVLDKSGKEIKLTEKNGKYTFAMPASSVTVEAAFKAEKSGSPFVDVPSGSYYEDAVIWAADKGITGGTDAVHFAPNGVCTRAQAVTFLWRAAGSPAPKSAAMPFTDVKAGSYYEQAVLWAVENGITRGTSDTTFSPNLTCTRAQIVTFLWRSQKSPAAGSENPFTDVKSDAYYADAVLWAVKESVTSGTAATTFSPDADCTRAQIVTFIYRALAE